MNPLNLPAGSVRAIIALLVILPVAVLMLIGRTVPSEAIGLAGVVLGYYFRQRDGDPAPAPAPEPEAPAQ